jgi:hypothetical protein
MSCLFFKGIRECFAFPWVRLSRTLLRELPGVHFYLILLCTGICFVIGFLVSGGLVCGILALPSGSVVLVLAGF